jgi:hypothetical protein
VAINGVEQKIGTTLSENAAVIGLGRRLGFRPSRQSGAAYLTELALDL